MGALILVVEDDDIMLETLVETLDAEGHDVVAAASGAEALAVAARSRALDLAVTDVRMAGMDGIQILSRLRQRQPDLASIVITGFASLDAPSRAMQEQTWDYLYKPFSRRDLVEAVDRVLHADEERGHFQRLRDALSAGYRQVVEAAQAAIVKGHLAALDRVRESAFRAFYVGVRSRKLGVAPSYAAWVGLEKLESDRERLKRGGVPAEERQALEHGYRYIADMLSSSTPEAVLRPPQAAPGQVGLDAFRELHKRIGDGRVGGQQLTLAPFLRTLDALALRQSPDLRALHASIWGSQSVA